MFFIQCNWVKNWKVSFVWTVNVNRDEVIKGRKKKKKITIRHSVQQITSSMGASSSKDLSMIFMISMSTLIWLRYCEKGERYILTKVLKISLFDTGVDVVNIKRMERHVPNAKYYALCVRYSWSFLFVVVQLTLYTCMHRTWQYGIHGSYGIYAPHSLVLRCEWLYCMNRQTQEFSFNRIIVVAVRC